MSKGTSKKRTKLLEGNRYMKKAKTVIMCFGAFLAILGSCKHEYERVEFPVFVYNESIDDSLEYILITTPNIYAYYPKSDRFVLVDERDNSVQILFANNDLIIMSEALAYQDNSLHVYYLRDDKHIILEYEQFVPLSSTPIRSTAILNLKF